MKKKYLFISAFLLIIIIFIIYDTLFKKTEVEVLEIKKGNLVTVIYATGTVFADTLAILRCETGGIVNNLLAREGSKVVKGERLLRTDQSDQKLNVKQAENNLKSAEIELENELKNYERKKNLKATNTISQNDYDEARKSYDIKKINTEKQKILLDIAKEKLSKTEVTAPFNGIIISSKVNLGDNLSPNAECFEIVAPTSIIVKGDVDEQDISKVSIGQKCIVAFDAFQGKRFEGVLYRIIPRTDQETKTSKVFIKIVNRPDNLNIGMTATINIDSDIKRDVLLLPISSVLKDGIKSYVFLVNGGTLIKKDVILGATEGKYTYLKKGNIKAGDIIAVNPSDKWYNGLKVKPVKK